MQHQARLSGVYAAALTPLNQDGSLDLASLPAYLDFLAKRGCHGALMLGTTGEGPSFAPNERIALLRAALEIHQSHPNFKLLVGTGTPSQEETIALTRVAFDLGYDGVVVLPPYYFKKVSDDGLLAWFSQVIQQAVPTGGAFFVYHIPAVSSIPLSIDLLAHLKDAFPDRFAGIKDSSGDPDHATALGKRFGKDILTMVGNDKLFSHTLKCHGSGAITALANLCSPDLRRVWDAFQQETAASLAQERLNAARSILDQYAPFPPILKGLLAKQHSLPKWSVRPPLMPVADEIVNQALAELDATEYVRGL